MEHYGYIESFTDIDDAFQFLDHKILQHVSEGWQVKDGSGMERVGMKWRVGLIFFRDKGDKVDG